jgi:hypothetical protein
MFAFPPDIAQVSVLTRPSTQRLETTLVLLANKSSVHFVDSLMVRVAAIDGIKVDLLNFTCRFRLTQHTL